MAGNSGAESSEEQSTKPGRRFWFWLLALLAIALVAVFAFGNLFSSFEVFDDEGYFLQGYKDFLSGHTLYNQVFSFYGPATYFLAALAARFNPENVTHDGFRWLWLGIWISVSAVLGATVWRWTKRIVPALMLVLLVGYRLAGLSHSVGHPQAWIILTAAFLLWLGLDWIFDANGAPRAFCSGLVLGAILLFKINIGVFSLVALASAIALLVKGRVRLALISILGLVTTAFAVSILLLTRSTGDRCFIAAYLISMLAIGTVALSRDVSRPPELRTIPFLALGLGLCLSSGLVGILLAGTTMGGLINGLIKVPASLVQSYHLPFKDAASGQSLATCAAALMIAAFCIWGKVAKLPPGWIGLIRYIVGAALIFEFFRNNRSPLPGSLLLLWLLIADGSRIPERMYSNRVFLGLTALLFSLQVFPMSGEQVDMAAVIPMLAAAILLGDGMNNLSETGLPFGLSKHKHHLQWTHTIAALILLYMFARTGRNTYLELRQWRKLEPLNLRGAHWLRLAPQETAYLHTTVAALQQNCQTVLTLPGLYSFSLWSGVPPSEKMRVNSWPYLWSDELKEQELRKARERDGCVLVNAESYRRFQSIAVHPEKDHSLPEIRETMRPVFADRDITLYRPSDN